MWLFFGKLNCLINKTNDCKNCYRCLRKCPVKSVSFDGDDASIIHDDCIYCGKCYLECPQSVIKIREDVKVVKRLLSLGKKVIVSSQCSGVDCTNVDSLALKSIN